MALSRRIVVVVDAVDWDVVMEGGTRWKARAMRRMLGRNLLLIFVRLRKVVMRLIGLKENLSNLSML